MWLTLQQHLNARAMVLSSLYAAMSLALVCSLALNTGHAGASIAKSAEHVAPLAAGDRAPAFTVQTAEGEPYDFNPEALERPAILITFRGGWCPYCNLHLSELRDVVPPIREMGVDVLFLSGDRPELLYASLSNEAQDDIDGLDYQILSDADAEAAIALGVAFQPAKRMLDWFDNSGTDVDGSSMLNRDAIAVPAVYAIGTDGEIAFAYANADYKVRLPSDELLEVAQGLVAAN